VLWKHESFLFDFLRFDSSPDTFVCSSVCVVSRARPVLRAWSGVTVPYLEGRGVKRDGGVGRTVNTMVWLKFEVAISVPRPLSGGTSALAVHQPPGYFFSTHDAHDLCWQRTEGAPSR
jgi:hypothetical protein